jgi:hypothetical protein
LTIVKQAVLAAAQFLVKAGIHRAIGVYPSHGAFRFWLLRALLAILFAATTLPNN